MKVHHIHLNQHLLPALGLATSVVMPTVISAHADEHSVQDAALVECTLENGDAAERANYVVKYRPDNRVIGPFCPATLDDVGGIWHWDGDEAGL